MIKIPLSEVIHITPTTKATTLSIDDLPDEKNGTIRVNCKDPFPVGKYIYCYWLKGIFLVKESISREPTKGVFSDSNFNPPVSINFKKNYLADRETAFTEVLKVDRIYGYRILTR